jgi:hypothetical protein
MRFTLLLFCIVFIAGCTQSGQNIQANELKDCGTDLDCFISAAESCEKTKLLRDFQTEVLGMVMLPTESFEIKGEEGGKCSVIIKTEKLDIKFSDSLKQQMMLLGDTEQEVQDKEKKASEDSKGTLHTCSFSKEDLVDMMNKLKTGYEHLLEVTQTNCKSETIKVSTGEVEGSFRPPGTLPKTETSPQTCENFCTEPCENCESGVYKCAYSDDKDNDGWADPFCKQCSPDFKQSNPSRPFDSEDCKEGFICYKDECINEDGLNNYLGSEGDECKKSYECKEGFHCFQPFSILKQGTCIKDETLNEFDYCNAFEDFDSYSSCNSKTCEDCKKETYTCDSKMEKCVQCYLNTQCKDGFVCQNYKCAPE